LKQKCIEVLQNFIGQFQARKAAITDEILNEFFDYSKPMQKE